MSNKFNPSTIQCLICEDIICSSYPGEWVCCSCFKTSHEDLDKVLEEKEIVSHSTSRFKLQSKEKQDLFYTLIKKTITGCYIDSTEHYERTGGNPASIKFIKKGTNSDT